MTDYADVVRRHYRDTVAYLLADGQECRDIRDDEITRIRRRLQTVDPAELPSLEPTGSWMLACILCPDDDLGPLTEWVVARSDADRARVRFYAHPSTDLVRAFKPWYRAGLDDPRVTVIHDWRTLHPPFGRDLNDLVYADATRRSPG